MDSTLIEQELHRELAELPAPQQLQVLDYVRSLRSEPIRGVPGKSLLRFAGAIPAAELAEMRAAIEADCERIDADGW